VLLNISKLQKSFGTNIILEDVTFILEKREKAALVGVNGAGKTSVFRLLSGEWEVDSGSVVKTAGIKIGYLQQMAEFASNKTLFEELDSVFDGVKILEANIRKLEKDMAGYSGSALEEAMTKYSRLTAEFESINGYSTDSRLKGVLKGLGFSEDQWSQKISSLSGGQQTRASLGKLLLQAPDLLLLDEPTNHLDIESIIWLEEYLKEYSGGILIISHDRFFLDRVTGKTIELENKRTEVYNGNYSFYAKYKSINREIAIKHYFEQQKEIKRQEKIIATFKARGTEKDQKRARSRQKFLEKMEKKELPESLPDQMRLMLTPKIETGYDVLEAEDLSMRFTGKETLFKGVSFSIKKGDKVALIGPNGIGKTTLLKIIIGEYKSLSGDIREGVHLRIGYYDQASQKLSEDKTIFQELADTYPKLTNTEIRNILAAFLFTGDDVFKEINLLSGGERGRVSLAKIMLGGANFLILDEPTNHLDLFSKEILEEALRDFPGTVLYISHDRYFINSTATKILELHATGVTEYLGNYDYYIQKKADLSTDKASSVLSKSGSQKNEWQQKKEEEAAARKLEARKKRLEEAISKIELMIESYESQLALDEIGRDPVAAAEIFTKKTDREEELLKLYDDYAML